MAIQAVVSKNIDQNYVQIDVKDKVVPTRHFKVPNLKADEFCSNYKKLDKKNNIISTLSLMGGAMLGGIALYPLWSKLNGKFARILCGTVGSLTGAGIAIYCNVKHAVKKENELIQKHGATEIFETKKEFPIK